jgi:transaldolase
MKSLDELTIKIFSDGADKASILEMYRNPLIKGFTTNPTLMRKAGVTHYKAFAREILEAIPDRPISFEVFSDEFEEMSRQALKIAGWGENVFVKIPITNTRQESAVPLIEYLAKSGVKINVTAMCSLGQFRSVLKPLSWAPAAYASLFAGRIADTGLDPVPLMAEAVSLLRDYPQIELLWASPREILNIFQADAIGCHIITVTHDILKKMNCIGKDLEAFSLETVQMFKRDADQAGYTL